MNDANYVAKVPYALRLSYTSVHKKGVIRTAQAPSKSTNQNCVKISSINLIKVLLKICIKIGTLGVNGLMYIFP